MKSRIEHFLQKVWYQTSVPFWAIIFLPLSIIYVFILRIRLFLYQLGCKAIYYSPIPTVVVGNLTVGGTGKTPLVIHLANLLTERKLRVGIISRGYKGNAKLPTWVTSKSDPRLVGDEAVLLATRLNCPIVVARKRVLAMQTLLRSGAVDVVISDDGLQHYALGRHIEIVVIEGKHRFGNGFCLPLGPLREPKNKLNTVDLIVTNGGIPEKNEYDMYLRPLDLYNACDPNLTQAISFFKETKIHAVAGIGFPQRFFELLRELGLVVIPHSFPDHHAFTVQDIYFEDEFPVIMTEKDFVKCKEFVTKQHWVLPIEAVITPLFDARFLRLLQEIQYG
jgi:tetraacyldisaccharide 4'-kinase